MSVKLNATRAQIHIFIVLFAANVAQQAGQHRQMNLFVSGWLGIQLPAMLRHRGVQLRVRIAPLAHTANVDEVLPQQLFVRLLSLCSAPAGDLPPRDSDNHFQSFR